MKNVNILKVGILALLLVSLAGMVIAFSGRGYGNDAARNRMEAGDFEGWKKAITDELTEERFNQERERLNSMEARRAGSEQVLYQGYSAWKESVEASPRGQELLEAINEENFQSFVEMHEAIQNHDFERADELADALGIEAIRHGSHRKKGLGCMAPSE